MEPDTPSLSVGCAEWVPSEVYGIDSKKPKLNSNFQVKKLYKTLPRSGGQGEHQQ